MKKTKLFFASVLLVIMVIGTTMTSLANGWQQDAVGWWYGTNADNTDWYINCWQWIDGNGDGIAECYCFDENGYIYVNTFTPDGYLVNADGQWIDIFGVVQTQIVTSSTTRTSAGGSGGSSGGGGGGGGGRSSGSSSGTSSYRSNSSLAGEYFLAGQYRITHLPTYENDNEETLGENPNYGNYSNNICRIVEVVNNNTIKITWPEDQWYDERVITYNRISDTTYRAINDYNGNDYEVDFPEDGILRTRSTFEFYNGTYGLYTTDIYTLYWKGTEEQIQEGVEQLAEEAAERESNKREESTLTSDERLDYEITGDYYTKGSDDIRIHVEGAGKNSRGQPMIACTIYEDGEEIGDYLDERLQHYYDYAQFYYDNGKVAASVYFHTKDYLDETYDQAYVDLTLTLWDEDGRSRQFTLYRDY